MIFLHEARDPGGLLDKIQIPALEIFDQRQQAGFLVVHGQQDARHLAESGKPRRAQAAFSRDQLHPVRRAADGERLEDAELRDAGRQLLERG